MGTIRLVLRTDKPLKNGKSPVDLIYQVSGQRKYFRTDIKLYPQSWDPQKQKPLYIDKKQAKRLLPDLDYDLLLTSDEVEEINSAIQHLISTIQNIEKRYQLDRIPYSSQMVVERLAETTKAITKKEAPTNVVFDFMQKYIDDHKATREGGSLSVYKSVKNHLQNYCKATGKKVTFDNIDYNFFQSFQGYLLQDKFDADGKLIPGLNNTTVAKQLSTIKTFLNYARKQGIAVTDKYKDFRIKKESMEVIALTEEEFQKLYHMDLSENKRLAQTRDVFCFSCLSGLRYSDLEQLRWEHIKNDEIKLRVTKTKEPLTIPLTPYSMAILEIYEGKAKPLPVISNQNLNYAIKDLCEFAEINEPVEIVRFKGAKKEATVYKKYELIGCHNGRKTFATLSLERGMSAEEVMSIGGWKDYKSFKRYVKITEKRNKLVMMKAWGNVVAPVLKAV